MAGDDFQVLNDKPKVHVLRGKELADEFRDINRRTGIQNKSETFRYGDTNPGHVRAITRIEDFWNRHKHPGFKDWIFDVSWVEQYSEKFVQENPDRNRVFNAHTPDIVLFQWMEDQPVLRLVIEVDGESHSSKIRQISDKIFEKWINRRYQGLGVKLIRLQKAELEGPLDLAHEYLHKELGEFLK